ncbi:MULTISPECIES: TenA family protein [Roseobacteraceae]|jgi:thiaminase/transcriptional activator TenA|uniref:Aminopyrimidine aminohydrolase n=1 Tax=Pseudosulfitobacter pseudonitzschiae TaxID=1402135 RepID=A0A221K6N7_9RHOB|nr:MULTISPECIES: TenA family protein [Roseobacteraceae]ASM74661.1 aminopyrimidine aminohydrolase [Pseudosulfitobacter pseudonitzschiae]
MTAPDYGKTFALWRAGAAGVWADYTRHAFVQGLSDGTLPRAAFLRYLVQDYVFLVHFSRAWSLGVIKSETLGEMKVCAGTVDALVNHEMSLHVQTCAAAGIDEHALFTAPEAVENLAYTRYVMDAGAQGDFLDLMAALAPCVMGYGEIGLRLAQERAADTPYADWIDTYADAGYQQVCTTVGTMIDTAVARRVGDLASAPRRQAIQDRFTKATTLEVGFWQMGLTGP